MAISPAPRLRLGFFTLPPNASYVPRTRTPMGDIAVLSNANNVAAPRYAWTQLPYQFLDDVFTFYETPLLGGQITDFSATLRLNEGCDWRFSWQYDVGDPAAEAFVAAAAAPGAFCAWYIQTADVDDEVVSLRGFMGGGVLSSITEETSPVLPTVFVPRNHYTRRGMSGPVSVARVSHVSDDVGLLEVSGTCWAAALNDTLDTPAEPNISPPTSNSVYGNNIPTTSARRQVDIRVWMAHLFRDSSDLKATAQHVSPSPTQLGRWLLRPAFTRAALDRMSELTNDDGSFVNYRYEQGPHSILRSLQRVAARAGLVIHTEFPLIWFDAGVSTTADVVFREATFSSSTYSRRKPSGNYFVVSHGDPVSRLPAADGGVEGGVITVVREDTVSSALHGIIARTLTSTVPQRSVPEAGQSVAVSNADVRELLEAQVAAEILRGYSTSDGDIETNWLASARYGIDWNLGSTAELHTGGLVSDLLLINSVAIRLDSGGDWSFRAGLGPTADLAPQIRHKLEAGATVSF